MKVQLQLIRKESWPLLKGLVLVSKTCIGGAGEIFLRQIGGCLVFH